MGLAFVDRVVHPLPVELCHLLEQCFALVHVAFLPDGASELSVFAAGEEESECEVDVVELAGGEGELVAPGLHTVPAVLDDHCGSGGAHPSDEADDAGVARSFSPCDGLDHGLRVDMAPELFSVAHVDEPFVAGEYGSSVDDEGLGALVGFFGHAFLDVPKGTCGPCDSSLPMGFWFGPKAEIRTSYADSISIKNRSE